MFRKQKTVVFAFGIIIGSVLSIIICFFILRAYVPVVQTMSTQLQKQQQTLTTHQEQLDALSASIALGQTQVEDLTARLSSAEPTVTNEAQPNEAQTSEVPSEISTEASSEASSEITPPSTAAHQSAMLTVKGINAPLASYPYEGGQVPTYTPYAYRWTIPALRNHQYYLVDQSNSTGIAQNILGLKLGDTIELAGTTYTVQKIQTIYPHQYASDLCDFSYPVFLQTCYSENSKNGMRLISLQTN